MNDQEAAGVMVTPSKYRKGKEIGRRSLLSAMVLGAAILAAPMGAWAQPPSLKDIPVPEPPNLADYVKDKAAALELVTLGVDQAFLEKGFSNIAVSLCNSPIGPNGDTQMLQTHDGGRGGTSPFINPLTNQPCPLSHARLAVLKRDGLLPASVAAFVPDLPAGAPAGLNRTVVDGAFKTPMLRNVELTGPYFHTGGAATLRQVVEFYTRGGNFPATNFDDLAPDIELIQGLDTTGPDPQAAETRLQALVAFLAHGLTDERVALEKAPFDHPELFIPDGAPGNEQALKKCKKGRCDSMVKLPAVGTQGRGTPIPRFLDLDPQQPYRCGSDDRFASAHPRARRRTAISSGSHIGATRPNHTAGTSSSQNRIRESGSPDGGNPNPLDIVLPVWYSLGTVALTPQR